ncbi:hypothetical protein [Dyadobacter sp. Leaf189]|uniref:hypothetical protein n=1 Tax=Dyadobacter sp. Leaf189 TaxID=1736295 RepID=UPI0006F6D8FE|nr:hypothetical protein [Dyadobacter sp. Leaf189]KQS34002.1 hypothetical protein ASG33_08200 [Dyadobacter sp. Leaf189]
MMWKINGPSPIPLTEEEKTAVTEVAIRVAILEAEKEKGFNRYKQLYAVSVTEEKVFPELTPAEFQKFIVELGVLRSQERGWPQEFQLDENNRVIVKSLAHYFTNSPKFSAFNAGFSLNKGIMLVGDVGCGKTQLMELCSKNPKLCYARHDCIEVAGEYTLPGDQGGENVIQYYSENSRSPDVSRTMGHEFYGRFFDDLGAESSARHYGNEKNVMEQIILNRYKFHPHHMTHFTTNLVMEDLQEVYGKRVADRLKEMCNVIEFPATAKSRRK